MLGDAIEGSVAANDRRLELRGRLELANIRWFRDPQTSADDFLAAALKAVPTFEAAGDDRALGRAWLMVGLVRGSVHCEMAAWEDAAARAAAHYRRAGWSPSTCLSGLASALYYGPTPVHAALVRCAELLDENRGDRMSEANVLMWMGGLEAMLGRFDEGRRRVEDARRLYEEFGQTLSAGDACNLVEGAVEMLAGRHDEAERALRRACETCLRLNESALLSSRAAELADALYGQGRYEEAAEWARLSRERAGSEDVHAQASWRAAQSKIDARLGDLTKGERWGREACELLEHTDALNDRARSLLALAEVLGLGGEEHEAAELMRLARGLLEQKGNVVALRRVRTLLHEPSHA